MDVIHLLQMKTADTAHTGIEQGLETRLYLWLHKINFLAVPGQLTGQAVFTQSAPSGFTFFLVSKAGFSPIWTPFFYIPGRF